MTLIDIAALTLAFLLLTVGVALLRGSLLLFFSRRETVESAKYHSPLNIGAIANGDVPAYRNGRRDYAVSAGLAIKLRDRKLQAQGRVSDELIEPLL